MLEKYVESTSKLTEEKRRAYSEDETQNQKT